MKYKIMRKIKIDILIIILIGFIPFLWYKAGYIIARGDYFPYVFNLSNIISDFYLWSPNNGGVPSPAHFSYAMLWFFSLVVGVELWQIILYSLMFFSSAFSMSYLSKTVYPGENFTAIIACVFYVFNFFTTLIILNIGMIFTYAFLPLLLAFFIKTLTQSNFKYVVYFAITFALVSSISSINVANVVLITITVASVSIYFVFSKE